MRLFRYSLLMGFVCLPWSFPAFAQGSEAIRLNQIGFYPSQPKIAIVKDGGSLPFCVIADGSSDTLYRGVSSASKVWQYSEESVGKAEFTPLARPGRYRVCVPGIGISFPFEISPHVFGTLAAGAMKSYYYQRASIPLVPKYAGIWARAEGHPDTSVMIHPSAAGPRRAANSTISAPRGWYDAGDYNKYIVNSGITTYTILATYENFPEYCATMDLNIPESGNGIPDILNEALWNIRWMLTMQDPDDGGVYAKLTNTNFEGFIMPAESLTPRYIVMKSTGSTLDFAAVLAQTARVIRSFERQLPGFADTCLQAAIKAWTWARRNPDVLYDQRKMNATFKPEIHTGDYGDRDLSDEFAWAAAELTATTRCDSFLTVANPVRLGPAVVPGWPDVGTLGLYTLAHYRSSLAGIVDTGAVVSRLLLLADTLRASMEKSAYGVVMGARSVDFGWGSNGTAANQAMELMTAYQISGKSTYLAAALSNIDYLLGRNATTYCFVTAFGSHSPMRIHHRISGADSIPEPVPGFLVGGPNPNKQDYAKTYPSFLPGRGYTDDQAAYASNEICINWNAPLVYILVGMESLK